MKTILVIGGGFAGLWAALGARRRLDEAGAAGDGAAVLLINRDTFHAIRVRNYESDLDAIRVPLAQVLDPAGVAWRTGEVTAIDAGARRVTLADGGVIAYDRLILAAGSRLRRPPLPGLAEHGFHIDDFAGAARLDAHLRALCKGRGRATTIVAGAGLTGIELACELPSRLRAYGADDPRVILADAEAEIGSDMGRQALPLIREALAALGVECRPGIRIAELRADALALEGGETIPAQVVIWTAGVEASPLAALIHADRDRFGRLRTDEYLRVPGCAGVYAVGDIAAAPIADGHDSVMSCQHGRPMGRFGGHNAAASLVGGEELPLRIERYVTCLDLGPWGAIYTEGWDRRVVASGMEAKKVKMTINRERIYPPRSGLRAEILAEAGAALQASAGAVLARR